MTDKISMVYSQSKISYSTENKLFLTTAAIWIISRHIILSKRIQTQKVFNG